MVNNTTEQYQSVLTGCKDIFLKKMQDYGTAWRILRSSSLTDQIFIKANRIRTIQEKGISKVDEGIAGEFMAMVNYCVMALIQLSLKSGENLELDHQEAERLYDQYAASAHDLMVNKNHDYGEAWRDMRISSLTDLILMKILRIKQIENNKGLTIASEGIDANYYDILNYSIFALILIGENETNA